MSPFVHCSHVLISGCKLKLSTDQTPTQHSNEKFYVKDGTTGFLLQGQEDTDDRQVPHLVRMEMTVKTEKNGTNGSFRNTLDNWIITDIDDMMEGNLVI